MEDLTRRRSAFAERLRGALEDSTTANAARTGRHEHQRVSKPLSSSVANPARVRHSDELFVERLRSALD
jgi:hypothetical protein